MSHECSYNESTSCHPTVNGNGDRFRKDKQHEHNLENWEEILGCYYDGVADMSEEKQWKLWSETCSLLLHPLGPNLNAAVCYEAGFEKYNAVGNNSGGSVVQSKLSKRGKRVLRQNIHDYQLRYFVPYDSHPVDYHAPWHLPQQLPGDDPKSKRLEHTMQWGYAPPVDEDSWERHLARPSSSSSAAPMKQRERSRRDEGKVVQKTFKFKSGKKQTPESKPSFVSTTIRKRIETAVQKKKAAKPPGLIRGP